MQANETFLSTSPFGCPDQSTRRSQFPRGHEHCCGQDYDKERANGPFLAGGDSLPELAQALLHHGPPRLSGSQRNASTSRNSSSGGIGRRAWSCAVRNRVFQLGPLRLEARW